MRSLARAVWKTMSFFVTVTSIAAGLKFSGLLSTGRVLVFFYREGQ
jgi:hypothetical protein